MRINKNKTACFSGYRPHKFDFPLQGDEYELLTKRLFDEISKEIEVGYDTFIVDMAAGFDVIAAEAVILARRVFSKKKIRLICALPYEHYSKSNHFNAHWRERYDGIMRQENETINVTNKQNWTKGCYFRRNDFMVDNSSLLICYSTGKSGGMENTIKYAENKGVKIVNIVNNALSELIVFGVTKKGNSMDNFIELLKINPNFNKCFEQLCHIRRDEIISALLENDGNYQALCKQRNTNSSIVSQIMKGIKKEKEFEDYSDSVFEQEAYEIDAVYKAAFIDAFDILKNFGLIKL